MSNRVIPGLLASWLIACWSAPGQGFGTFANDQPFLAGPLPLPSGPYPPPDYHWVASDTFTNGTNVAVSVLVDRVQGAKWTQLATALQATNNSTLNALGFSYNLNYYTNFPGIPIGTNFTIMMVVMPSDDKAFGPVGQMDFWSEWTTSFHTWQGSFGGGGAGNATYDAQNPASTVVQLYGPTTVSNKWSDLTWDGYGSSPNGSLQMMINGFTNGATSTVYGTGNHSINGLCFNNGNGSFTDNSFNGYIREILIWLESLTAAQVLAWHGYETNLYKYSP